MREQDETVRTSRIVAGALLVVVGGVLLLQELGVVSVGGSGASARSSWSGRDDASHRASRRESRSGGAVLLALGSILQAEQLGVPTRSLADLWPILLVAVGLVLVLEAL